MEHSLQIVRVNISQLATLHEVAEVSEGEAAAPAEDGGGEEGDAEADAGEEGSGEGDEGGSDSEAAASEDGGSGEVSPRQLVKQRVPKQKLRFVTNPA